MGLNLPTYTLWRYMKGDVSTNVMNFISCTKDMVFLPILETTLQGSGKVSRSMELCSRKLKNIIQ